MAPRSMKSLPDVVPSRSVFSKSLARMEDCDGRLDHGGGDVARSGAQENAVDGTGSRGCLPGSVWYGPPFSGQRFCRARHEPSLAAGNLLHHGDDGPVCRGPAGSPDDYPHLHRHAVCEIASGTIQAIATKPVPRWQLLIGKWLGFCGMLSGYIAIMVVGVNALTYVMAGVTARHLARGLSLMWMESIVLLSVLFAFATC